MHSCNHSCSPWIRIRIEELLHYSRGPHQNMFLERSWNRMHESTWRTLMLCLQSGGQSMPPMLSEWNSGTQRSASTYPLRYFDLACAKKIKVSMPTAIRFIAAYHFAGVKIVVALESVQFEEPVRVHVHAVWFYEARFWSTHVRFVDILFRIISNLLPRVHLPRSERQRC